jgi:hypothetical protein
MAADTLAVDQLGPRWAFTFNVEGAHTRVQVRVGEPGSRGLAGSFKVGKDEAEQLRKVVAAAGAVVLP